MDEGGYKNFEIKQVEPAIAPPKQLMFNFKAGPNSIDPSLDIYKEKKSSCSDDIRFDYRSTPGVSQ